MKAASRPWTNGGSMTKRTRLKLKPKFYIFIAMAAAAVIGLLVLFIPGRSWGVVSYGSFGTNRDVSTAITL